MQVFNSEGEFLLKFGSNGEGNGQFNAPTGVAVDANGNIIVADWGNSRIQVRSEAELLIVSSYTWPFILVKVMPLWRRACHPAQLNTESPV